MYLEISGRRAGKTTRLIKEVYNCVLHYNSIAIIFAYNMTMANIIMKEHFNHGYFKDNVFIFSTKNQYLRWLSHRRGIRCNKNIRLFYDEFASKTDVIIDIQGYYTTTPFKSLYTDTDTLAKLVKLNNDTFIKYINNELIEEIKNELSKEHVETELFANFNISRKYETI